MNPGGLDPSTGHPTVALRLIAAILLVLESPILAVFAAAALGGAFVTVLARLWRRLTGPGATA